MQKGKIEFFQIPIIKIGLWWIYFRRHTNGCGLVPHKRKICKDIQPIVWSQVECSNLFCPPPYGVIVKLFQKSQ